MKILLVTSPGGHLAQLLSLKSWWVKHERDWVTFNQSEVTSSLSGERISWAYFPTSRNALNAIRNFWLAWPTLRRIRPDLVISNGAGVSVPFFIVCKFMKIRTVYIECFDRITLPTMSGTICYPISDLFCVQWDEQKRFYPDAVNIGHLL
ncbi:PssD/Cps14F family polysaccharide biosynthesis glycosyltransferase [Glutamicibacter protophormiae]|uniref:PssD/Cps14F family polysaccharide biosynthesis glycosyltransferase n=1 Tax=Glutamicibacter protophormiae TaxID=37930 RepID=UPI003A8C8D7B